MKEEEIRPIAENYVEEYCHLPDGEYTDGSLVCAGIGTALIVSRQLEKRIAELEKQIVDLKDYILQVSKFLHNNNNTRPDKLAYKERDVLLIKELKLFEKWELSK